MLQGFAMSNPVWPSAYDGVWNALIGLVSVCMFAALFVVMRKATPLRAIEWVVLIMLVPILVRASGSSADETGSPTDGERRPERRSALARTAAAQAP